MGVLLPSSLWLLKLPNRSFNVVERMRMSTRCAKMKTARAKRAELLFFFLSNMQICEVVVAVVVVVKLPIGSIRGSNY